MFLSFHLVICIFFAWYVHVEQREIQKLINGMKCSCFEGTTLAGAVAGSILLVLIVTIVLSFVIYKQRYVKQ